MVVFQGFRRFLEAIVALTSALGRLAEIQKAQGPAIERLEKLELTRHHFEAECQGLLLRAEGKSKAANSSEQRERQLKKANDRYADIGDIEGLDQPATPSVRTDDVERGEAEGLRPVPLALAPNNKTHAIRAKFGI